MSNIIRFPAGRPVPAERIPREQFERLAGLALDVVDQILVLLDAPEVSAGTAMNRLTIDPGEGIPDKDILFGCKEASCAPSLELICLFLAKEVCSEQPRSFLLAAGGLPRCWSGAWHARHVDG